MIQVKVISVGGEEGANSEGPDEAQSAAWVVDLGGADGEGLVSGLCGWANRVENVEELSLRRKVSLSLG